VKSRAVVLGVVALVAACTSSVSTTTAPATTASTSTTLSESTTSSETTASTLPAGTEELPEALREDIARLIPITEELRELSFREAPAIRVLTSEELAAEVIAQVLEDYDDAEADEALYKLLGLVEPEFDLLATLTALYGEQVAGYYDGDNEELVVTAREDDFSPLEEATIVHELTHALTDQVLDFNDRFNALFDNEQFDQASAFQSLIEGDASLTELLYIQQLDPAAQQEFLEEAFAVDTTVFDQVPQFVQDSLTFPYDTGFGFVEDLYGEGGFAAIDEAYANPPVSTEQIINPDDFGTDHPLDVPLPENQLAGYEIAYGSTWGELGYRLMFDQILGGADSAADGWGGDSYAVYFNGTEVLLVMVYQGDTPEDAAQLANALNDYVSVGMELTEPAADGNGQAYTGDRYAFVSAAGNQVVFVAASDPTAGASARGWFPGF
jgi:hypothetical protein